MWGGSVSSVVLPEAIVVGAALGNHSWEVVHFQAAKSRKNDLNKTVKYP